jgi:hypothetical protein
MPDVPVLRPVEVAARMYGDAVTVLLTAAATHGCPLASVTAETHVPGSAIFEPTITCHVLPTGAHPHAEALLASLDPAHKTRHTLTPSGLCHHGRVVLGDTTIPVRLFVRNTPMGLPR